MSLFLALVMVCSLSVSAFAVGNETVITYTGAGTEAYTITVPTTLQPGQSGTVKAQGTWATNRTLKVTTANTVTVANSIDGGEKVLDVTFAGIDQAGDNTTSITVSKTISVGDISNALFGTCTGVITYNVSIVDNGSSEGEGSGSEGSGSEGNGKIPEGGTYTQSEKTYSAGETFPTISDGDTYSYGDYTYTYHVTSKKNYYDVGWNVNVSDTSKSSYGEILSEINGEPVTSMYETFMNCTSLTTAPVIPSSVTGLFGTFTRCDSLTTVSEIPSSVIYMTRAFYGCASLTGNIEINASPSFHTECFLGTKKPITLSGSSTKLEALKATSTNGNITVTVKSDGV